VRGARATPGTRCMYGAWVWVSFVTTVASVEPVCQSGQNLQGQCLLQSRVQQRVRSEGLAEASDAGAQPAAAQAAVAVSQASREQELAAEVAAGSYALEGVRSRWSAYQEALVERLRAGLVDRERAPLRVLLAAYLGSSGEVAVNWRENVQRLRANGLSDRFDFALFHCDGSNSLYQGQDWYDHPSVRIRHLGAGCPSMFWLVLNVSFVQLYDYIWLSDGDMNLGFFSWDLYRTVLVRLQPMVSQPSIVPIEPGRRASDVLLLNMAPALLGDELVLVREIIRSEVMTPVLSTSIWGALHARLAQHNLHTTYFSDTFWDMFALASKAACGKTGVVLVDASPARHLDLKAILSSTGQSAHCTSVEGALDNNHRVDAEVMRLAADGVRSHCSKAAELLLSNFTEEEPGTIQRSLQEATAEMRQWSASALLAL